MNFKRTTRTSRGFGQCLLIGGAIAIGTCQTFAGDLHWVTSDRNKVAITRSTDELGVIFHRTEDASTSSRRLEAQGVGKLEDFPQAPWAHVKLIRIKSEAASRRQVVQQDPAVKEIHPVYRIGPRDAIAVGSGSFLVKVRPEIPVETVAQLWTDFGVASAEPLDGMNGVFRVVPKVEDGEVELSEAMAGDARVVWAQPNFHRPLRRSQLTINDPFYNRQWHLNNTGQAGTAGADIDAPEAWQVSDGTNVLIGLFDDGIDVDHEDLRDGYIGTGQDPTVPSNDLGFNDPRPKILGDSHGTSVAGLAFARANDVGGRGVAFASRFTASRGLGEMLTDAEIASVFTFARQQKVDVHINSWGLAGYPPNPQVIVDAIELAFDQGRQLGDLNGDGTPDPPRGMVIVFAAGNDGIAIPSGFDLSTIPQVISVGATGPDDVVPLYSNFGVDLDVVAPGGGDAPPGLFTTDVTDKVGNPENGQNVGGTNPESGNPEPDAAGKYIDSFAGTSAACPVVGGVAALVLSVNPALTATDVRIILEHSADKVSPNDASYNPITSRSNVYGYGRVNAGGAGAKVGAVEAARESLSNGGLTWPDRASRVAVANSTLNWHQGANTDEFLVLQSNSDFQFVPADGVCYDTRQNGCGAQTIQALPTGVSILAVGCNFVCSGSQTPKCETGAAQCVSFLESGSTKTFAIYGRSQIGRYSFGVAANSNGGVIDSGPDTGSGSSGGTVSPPAVTITATPLQGQSPLLVSFNGNAVSAGTIDESRTSWDFDTSDGIGTDATSRMTSHTYTVASGETKTFVARLTMFDTDGRSGFAQVGIKVTSDQGGGSQGGTGNFQIIVSLPNSAGSNVSDGNSPFSVILSVDAADLTGTLQSIVWDLGDGARASSLTVLHTYTNTDTTDLRIPITATVTMSTAGQSTATFSATRVITVHPGTDTSNPGTPDLPGTHPGGAATPCSGLGMLPMFVMLASLVGMKSRTRNRK